MGDLSKYFSRSEFLCKCGECDSDTVDAQLLSILEDVRNHFGAPIKVTSGHRCKKYNSDCGGALNSWHLSGRAADIQVAGIAPEAVYSYIDEKHPVSLGLGASPLFCHVDSRDRRGRWSY